MLCAYRSLPEVARFQSWESFGPEDAAPLINEQAGLEFGIPATWFQLARAVRQEVQMEASYKIRPAQLADGAEIARLSVELGYPATTEDVISRLPALLESARHFVVAAAELDSRLLGWLAAERRILLQAGEKAEITGLVVEPSARRAGVGKRLISAAERWGARQGSALICVRSNVIRPESHSFYEKLGYVRKKTQHFYEKGLTSV
jgi:GNAT superfamily N-acetyltransferase